jgi:catechol 2,3-dioxygenase-like lactoylglutathione lyase family enzyme
MDWKLELIILPVSDVDRAKAFYSERAGFGVDVDVTVGADMRIVQLTPPGSACSITLMHNDLAGTVQGLHLVVNDIDAARAELVGRGAEVSDVYHFVDGEQVAGPDPQHQDYGSFLSFSDPDGNGWVVQEVRRATTDAPPR